jgi:peptidoglycan/xylan/chitin deacetylase (PgdA/CDA1 family)
MSMFPATDDLPYRQSPVAGLSRAFRVFFRRRLLVLNYHGVVSDECARRPHDPNIVGVSEFSRQMSTVARLFSPIGASELPKWRAGRGRVTRSAVLVTFDDGYRNNLTYAAPVLQRYGIPALIAICPGYIGQKRMLWPNEIQHRVLWWSEKVIPVPFSPREQRVPDGFHERLALANRVRESCKRLPHDEVTRYLAQIRQQGAPPADDEIQAFLSWEEVDLLKARGFEIGAHTMEHPILTQLPYERLTSELRESKRIIEQHTGCECVCFAYPNGGAADISPVVVDEVHRAGYQFAFTVTGRLASAEDDPLLIDRIYIPGSRSAAEFKARISGFHFTWKHSMIG